jgi:hypothetical protein
VQGDASGDIASLEVETSGHPSLALTPVLIKS